MNPDKLAEINRRIMYVRGFIWATLQEDAGIDSDTREQLLDVYNHLSSSMFALMDITDKLEHPND